MQTLYSSSVPPGLTAPTRGELKIRIERLQLHHESLVEVPAVAPYLRSVKPHISATDEVQQNSIATDPVELKSLLDLLEENLVVVPLFWGENPAIHSAECYPVTDNLSEKRTITTIISPIKTVHAQLAQYFHHTAMSPLKGLPLRLVLPSSKTGKRQAVEVGSATINLSALGPTTPISGWYAIVGQNAQGELVGVGRLKVHVSANYYQESSAVEGPKADATKKAAPRPLAKGAPRPAAQKTPIIADGSLASPPLSPNALQDVGRPPLHRGQTPPQPSRLSGRKTGSSQQPTDATSSAASTYGLSNSGGDSSTTHLAPPTASDGIAQQMRSIQHRKLDDIYSKFQYLRDELSLAAGRTELSPASANAAATEAHFQQQLSDLYRRHAPGLSSVAGAAKGFTSMGAVGVPTGIEHRMGDHRSAGSAKPSDFLMDAESSEAESDEDGSAYDRSADEDEAGAAHSTPLKEPHSSSPRRFYDQSLSEVHLNLTDFAFTDVVDEIRIQLRLSKDVSCPTPFEALSSFVYYLPPATADNVQSLGSSHHRGISIPLHFTVSSFSSESRLVVECYSVHSRPSGASGRIVESEALIGVLFLGLYSAEPRAIKFHDPITGRNPVEAVAEVRVMRGDGHTDTEPTKQRALTKKATGELPFDTHSYESNNLLGAAAAPKMQHEQPPVDIRQPAKPRDTVKERSRHRHRRAASKESSSSSESMSDTDSYASSDDDDDGPLSHGGSRAGSKVVIYQDPLSSQTVVTINTTKAAAKEVAPAVQQVPTISTSPPVAAQPTTRLHISLKQAKGLPQVQVKGVGDGVDLFGATGGGATITLRDTNSTSPQPAALAAPPHTFLVIEDFILNETAPPPSVSSEATVASSAFREFVQRIEDRAASGNGRQLTADWSVDGVVRGNHDRTLVTDSTCTPQFNYESSVAIQHPPSSSPTGQGVNHLPLSGMLVSVWHAQPASDVSSGQATQVAGDDAEEAAFWSRACRIGTSFIDLKGLKYIPTAEGWYRCYSDHHCLDTAVGYVQVAVRRL